MLPYCILFGEHQNKLFKTSFQTLKTLPGTIIRQLTNISFFFLIAAFSNTLKAVLVNPGSPELIKFNHQIMKAGKPVILYYGNRVEHEALMKSNSRLDKWLYENAEAVFFFDDG